MIQSLNGSNAQLLAKLVPWALAVLCLLSSPAEVQVPASPAAFAEEERLTIKQAIVLLRIREQIVAHRSSTMHELANYLFVRRLVKRVRLMVSNTGEVPATEARLEIHAINVQGFGIVDGSEIPKAPRRRESVLAITAFDKMKSCPTFQRTGYVDIEKNDHETKVEIECGNLKPGRKVWTDTFWMGIGRSGGVNLTGHLVAANLPQPQEFTLTINAAVNRTTLTVESAAVTGQIDVTTEGQAMRAAGERLGSLVGWDEG